VGVPQLDRTQREVYKQLVRTAVASREAATDAGLDEGLLELVNVRVSQLNGCAACLATHVPAAREAGVSEQRLDLLPAWRELDRYGDRERAALRLAETLTRLDDGDERAAATQAAAEVFSDEQLSALEWTVVLINAFNRVSIASHHQPSIED
jgi:AhpD family alkylhydroperoxidase